MRILIVDDNELVRRGIKKILALEPAWEICGEAVNGEEAMQQARDRKPDLLLLDISMPGGSGLETARQLRLERPDIKILILSQHASPYLTPQALKAGADGCLDKARVSVELIEVIRALDGGKKSAA